MKCNKLVLLTVLAFASVQTQARAISLESAGSFGLLGGTGVTNSGLSIVSNGNVGSSPTPAVTGFPPGVVNNGILFTTADPVTAQAKTDLITAYNAALAAPGGTPGPDLGGVSLEPGVYTYVTTAPWAAGTLTLNGLGDPNSEWIFQIGTGLTTPAGAEMVLVGGASSEHVFWQIGTSATLGAANTFAGNILALTSVTLDGGTLHGRAMAINGLVSISTAQIVNVPEPGTPLSLGSALASLFALKMSRSRLKLPAMAVRATRSRRRAPRAGSGADAPALCD